MTQPTFPTALHEKATGVIKEFFILQEHIDTVLLTNSLARGQATPESDIDMAILITEKTPQKEYNQLEENWQKFLFTNAVLKDYKASSRFAQIHVDIIDGTFEAAEYEDGGAVDFFEVEIGNRLLYSMPLTNEGNHFRKLKQQWLPYYDAALQNQRLKLSKESCLYDLAHIPIFVNRGLYFQAFDRLYIAFQKFLQTLFISHKTYPIAYNKWINYQVAEILQLPHLYKQLPNIISVTHIESKELNKKAAALQELLEDYC